MSDEAAAWIRYAKENAAAAELCLAQGLYNPAIQNAQQSVEKALKALCLANNLPIEKTHSVAKLLGLLIDAGQTIDLNDDECELFDVVYLPSKYPLDAILPDYEPDEDLGKQCLDIAYRVLAQAMSVVEEK